MYVLEKGKHYYNLFQFFGEHILIDDNLCLNKRLTTII